MLFEAYREFIPQWDGFQEALRVLPPPVIRVNTLKCEPGRFCDRMLRAGIRLRPLSLRPYLFEYPSFPSPGTTLEFAAGWYHVQSLTSHIPVWVLQPPRQGLVLDLCAAPGGKTSLMAQEMDDSGLIVANEKKAARLPALGNTLVRLGITNTVTVRYPGEDFPKRIAFDRVLVDAPCSGEGRHRIGRNNKLLFYKNAGKRLPDLQKRLLVRGFDVLKPGGRLVYSTCTYNPDENEAVVAHLLNERDAEVERIRPEVPCSPGLTCYGNERYPQEVSNCVRIYPHFVNSVGFFIASLLKPAGAPGPR